MALALFVLPASAGTAYPSESRAVVGYYASWAAYQGVTPDQLPGDQLTHINYAFAAIDPNDSTLLLENPEQDRKNLKLLRALREKHPHLKLLISVGGWDDSLYFSNAAATAQRRERFAQSCLDFLLEHGLDGVDIDWEYPVSGGPSGMVHRPQDKQNFTLLLQAVRDKLDRQSKQDGRPYYLTIAGGAGSEYLNKIEVEAVARTVDHIFLMAYDIHGPWDTYADLNAPLYTPEENSPQYKSSVFDSVQTYLNRGMSPEKIVLGMPLYGYRYDGVSSRNNGLYSTFSSAASVPYHVLERNYLSQSKYRKLYHKEAEAPYLYGEGTFLSYETPQSMAAKAELARTHGLGGIGFWELSQDRNAVLIQSARAAFMGGAFTDVAPGDWYHEAVEYVRERGLMDGTSAGVFSPRRPVNRGMAAVIVHRLEGSPSAGKTLFLDVAQQSYCREAVSWAASKGIVGGYGDGRFGPDHTLTREQLAAILYRYARYKGYDVSGRANLTGYTDSGEIGSYAKPAMAWAVSSGLIHGLADARLAPRGIVTRAEAAVILMRFCESAAD
nr:glycosyl hydrolase family 18 protein [Dysosmobacter acutus]